MDEHWSSTRSTPAATAKKIDGLKKRLTDSVLKKANLTSGRALFNKHCANCHRLFDAGGNIGPDLTGSQRKNITYLLENIVDPSAVVAKDFLMEVLLLENGRTVTGIVMDESSQVLTLQAVNERITIPKNEIEDRKQSTVSLMPDGMLDSFDPEEIVDLIAYLASSQQLNSVIPRRHVTILLVLGQRPKFSWGSVRLPWSQSPRDSAMISDGS